MIREVSLFHAWRGLEGVQYSLADASRSIPVVEHASTSPPRTSLLSLPNDLLLMIYEEVKQDQDAGKTAVTSIVEILVNKRIFNLVRPLWLSRLSVKKPRIDQLLPQLLDDSARLCSLCDLRITFSESRVQLIKLVLSRLPRLQHLTFDLTGAPSQAAFAVLEVGVLSRPGLRRLKIHCASAVPDPVSVLGLFFERLAPQIPTLKEYEDDERNYLITRGGSVFWTINTLARGTLQSLDWSNVYGLRFSKRSSQPLASELLTCLEKEIQRVQVSLLQPSRRKNRLIVVLSTVSRTIQPLSRSINCVVSASD